MHLYGSIDSLRERQHFALVSITVTHCMSRVFFRILGENLRVICHFMLHNSILWKRLRAFDFHLTIRGDCGAIPPFSPLGLQRYRAVALLRAADHVV